MNENNYALVTTVQGIHEYIGGSHVAAFDFETSPDDAYRDDAKAALDPARSHIVGCSFSVAEHTGIYVPVAHLTGPNINGKAFFKFLEEFLTYTSILKIAHNISFESQMAYHVGIVIQAPVYDPICASQLSLKSSYEFRKLSDSGLKKLAAELCGEPLPSFSDEPTEAGGLRFLPGVLADHLSEEQLVFYAAEQHYRYEGGVYREMTEMQAQKVTRDKMISHECKMSQITDAEKQWRLNIQRSIHQNARVAQNQDDYQRCYDEMFARYEEAEKVLTAAQETLHQKETQTEQTESFITEIEALPDSISEFHADYWGHLVEKVTVHRKGTMTFAFACGVEIEA